MNKKINTLFEALKRPTLGGEEKESLRAALIAHTRGEMNLSTASARAPRQNYRSSSLLMGFRYHVALASFLVVAISGAGVVSAAEGSLPGDILYSIKTGLNEPVVRLVKATTPLSRALFETHLLEKRLTEAEQLETQNTLTNGVKVAVQTEVIAQKARAEAASKSASTATKKTKTATVAAPKARVATAPSAAAGARNASSEAQPQAMTLSLSVAAPASLRNETATATAAATTTPVVQVASTFETSQVADTAVEAPAVEVAVTETAEVDTEENLTRVFEKHRLILDKLDVKADIPINQ